MKHLRIRTAVRPVEAQLESVLQLVGLLQSLLALYTNVAMTFGITIPQKGPEEQD